MKDFAKSIVCNTKVGNSSHTKEEAKTKDEYFKILKFYQTQGYKTKVGESNPNGSIKLHKGDDSVEIVLVGNSKTGNADIVKDGNTWVVLYAEGTKSKEFATEAEAKKFVENKQTGNSKVGNKKIKGSYVTIDTSTGRVTFDDFAGKSFDVSRIDSSAGYELRVMQQQINDFKKALEEAKSLAKQNGLI